MSGSAHRIICASCRQTMVVSETPVPNPNGVSRTHLHAACENKACPESGKVSHKDVACSGSPVCGVHDNPDWHDPFVECPGGHGCGCA